MLTKHLLFFFIHLHVLRRVVATAAFGDEFVLDGFTGSNITLDGAASILENGLLLLTNSTTWEKGHAFHPSPLRVRDAHTGAVVSFATTFVFAIISDSRTDVPGNGLALVLTPTKNLSAALPLEYLGILDENAPGKLSNHLLAVELDTVRNPEFDDIDNNHVGIDINDLKSYNSSPAGYYSGGGELQPIRLASGNAMQVWIEYDGTSMRLDVTLAPFPMPKPGRPLLTSATVNLSSVLRDSVYVGFSAATGGTVKSYHCILGWSFRLNSGTEARVLDSAKLPSIANVVAHRASDDLRKLPLQVPLRMLLLLACPIITALLVAGGVYVAMRRRLKYEELREDWELQYGPHRFSYKDLFRATGGFKDKQLLGIGGFGSVYKGVLPTSKKDVAVKRVSRDSQQGMKEFIAEVVSIGRVRHRNLVQLLGYCRRKGELLLVYDYMPNGSLDKYLYGDGATLAALGWACQFQIIKGIAAGLLYLHEDWEQVVVHRDVKASNVLIDGELNGRLGDFGLARLHDHGADPNTTHVAGTRGYIAPELARLGKATKATDVFAFGAFLLEVTCGRRPIEYNSAGEALVLVDWVLDNWRADAILDTVDARLQGDYVAEEAALVLKLGLMCSHPSPAARPGMRTVMQYLDGNAPLPELSPMHLTMIAAAADIENASFGQFSLPYSCSVATTVTSLSGGR